MSANATLIESTSADFPVALRNGLLLDPVPRFRAIGNIGILNTRLLGFFCSTRCPGNVIVRTYDLAQALRAAEVPVIGGFHTPMEKECLDLLLRGPQPVVVCPARSITGMRLPVVWRKPLAENRLLVLSPFEARHRRPTVEMAEQRNRFLATLADDIFVAHAPAGSRTERLCAELIAGGKRVHTLNLQENAPLMGWGVRGNTVGGLVESLTPGQRKEVP
jgi:predicted Rossmann fold nucleotide-binding protein DprA/Smf involved in DNA uptake